MSQSLNSVSVTTFDNELKLVFQPKLMEVKNLVRVANTKGAKIHEFPLLGRASTVKRTNLQTPIPVANITHSKVSVQPEDFTLSEITDIFGQAKVPYDEIRALVETFALAARRRMVQFIIDALAAATLTGKTVAKNISGADDNLNMAMLRKATKFLDLDGVPSEDRTLMIHPNGLHYLTGETQVASADFNSFQALVKGGIDAYYGFNFFRVPNMADEGGLPFSSPDRTNYFFQKQAIGLAINMEPMTRTDWDVQYGGWRTTLFMSGKAVVIDPLGAGVIVTDDTKER